MSNDWYQDIMDFQLEVQKHNIPPYPQLPPDAQKQLRIRLIDEEINETVRAMDIGDLTSIADGIADSIVVLLGTAITYGIDIRPVWDIVHASNMAKVGGPIRQDGKVLKPAGWKPPNVAEELVRQCADAINPKLTADHPFIQSIFQTKYPPTSTENMVCQFYLPEE